MQSCNVELHQDIKHKEISNKEEVPQTYTTTSYVTLGLCKLNASRTTIMKYKNHVENPKHSCTKDRHQNMYSHPKMSQRKGSIISSKFNTRKKQTIPDLDQKTRKIF